MRNMKPCPECGGKVHFLDGRNVKCEKCYTVFHFDIDKIGAMGSSLGEEWDKLPRKGEQMKEIANCELCQRSGTKHCQGCHLGTNFLAKTAHTQKQHNDFYEAVCRQFKDCKTANDIAVRSFELMQIIADVSWEANASVETDKEAEELGVGK